MKINIEEAPNNVHTDHSSMDDMRYYDCQLPTMINSNFFQEKMENAMQCHDFFKPHLRTYSTYTTVLRDRFLSKIGSIPASVITVKLSSSKHSNALRTSNKQVAKSNTLRTFNSKDGRSYSSVNFSSGAELNSSETFKHSKSIHNFNSREQINMSYIDNLVDQANHPPRIKTTKISNNCVNDLTLKTFSCTRCSYTATTAYRIGVHHKSVHGNEKQFKCPHCEYETSFAGNYKRHMMIHSGERPFKCDQCPYASRHPCDIQKHKRTHTGEKPYKCSACCKAFARSSHLVTHQRSHTGEKPYTCSICDENFTLSQTLKVHLQRHTGNKPHKCAQCDYAAYRATHLKDHVKRVHSLTARPSDG